MPDEIFKPLQLRGCGNYLSFSGGFLDKQLPKMGLWEAELFRTILKLDLSPGRESGMVCGKVVDWRELDT